MELERPPGAVHSTDACLPACLQASLRPHPSSLPAAAPRQPQPVPADVSPAARVPARCAPLFRSRNVTGAPGTRACSDGVPLPRALLLPANAARCSPTHPPSRAICSAEPEPSHPERHTHACALIQLLLFLSSHLNPCRAGALQPGRARARLRHGLGRGGATAGRPAGPGRGAHHR